MIHTLIFAAVFAAAFMAVDHQLNAPSTRQLSGLVNFATIKQQTLHGTPRRWIAFVLLFVVSFLLLWALPFRSQVRFMPIAGATAVWLGWETCSILWSTNIFLSRQSLIPWIITAGVGFVTGAEVGASECVMIIALVSSVFLLVGYCNELLRGVSVRQSGYRFAGTLQPNRQGFNCAMLALSYCYLGSTNKVPFWIAIAGVLAGVGSLALARSRTPFWATEAASAFWAVVTPSGSSRAWPLELFAVIFLAGVVISRRLHANPPGDYRAETRESALSTVVLLGRPNQYVSTLNNRTELWRVILPYARENWLVGVGFGAFWDASRLDRLREATGRVVTSCHSTFIEIFVRSGMIGAILFIATLLAGVVVAFRQHQADGAFLCSLLVFVLFEAFVESIFALPNFGALFLFLLLGALSAA